MKTRLTELICDAAMDLIERNSSVYCKLFSGNKLMILLT